MQQLINLIVRPCGPHKSCMWGSLTKVSLIVRLLLPEAHLRYATGRCHKPSSRRLITNAKWNSKSWQLNSVRDQTTQPLLLPLPWFGRGYKWRNMNSTLRFSTVWPTVDQLKSQLGTALDSNFINGEQVKVLKCLLWEVVSWICTVFIVLLGWKFWGNLESPWIY